ncbi:hypothetical protein C2G38_2178431 [Gigaspora rosea]|uniref:F-box domain-containing protein n=1 Tax=Gigaspora rosea TaxID=44941 RepID=A0A397VG06_9GLOM|nr:hypothetical protein C2G38_2178431 [Gigaspora rosea]
MTSNIFMGDMPEIMEKILKNLNNGFYSLYSCALVSRHWCKISIPILWQDPFSIKQNSLFISQYISPLDESEKFVLKEYGIYEIFSKTLFDYANGAILHKLVLNLSNFLEIKPEIFNSLEQNDQFFSHLVLSETTIGFNYLRTFSISNEGSNEFYEIISSLEKQKSSLQEVNIENCAFSAEFEIVNFQIDASDLVEILPIIAATKA